MAALIYPDAGDVETRCGATDLVVALDDGDGQSSLGRLPRGRQPGDTGPENDQVEGVR